MNAGRQVLAVSAMAVALLAVTAGAGFALGAITHGPMLVLLAAFWAVVAGVLILGLRAMGRSRR